MVDYGQAFEDGMRFASLADDIDCLHTKLLFVVDEMNRREIFLGWKLDRRMRSIRELQKFMVEKSRGI